ncbi:MAG: cytidine deaminase [Holophagales bacterium]|jgi:cytidine deaminase|nr:cytidine deaminase [Holophagales bacterium]
MADMETNAPEWEPLLEAAWHSREGAHAPYSGFKVGAALLLSDGSIFPGCNVENAAYPLCVCAERAALCSAVSLVAARPGQVKALVVVTEANELTPPCGACRQAFAEFCADLPILLANRAGRKLFNLSFLLPEAFTSQNLAPNSPR